MALQDTHGVRSNDAPPAEDEQGVTSSSAPRDGRGVSAARPRIRFATTTDGARIAYTDEGHGSVPLVHMSQVPWNHLQLEWDMPEWRAWHEALGRGRRYVRYDGRGRGLSDRSRNEGTVETEILDLLAVLEATRVERCDLFAGIHTSLTALEFAANYPERVRRLVLWGPYSKGEHYMTASLVVQAGAMMVNDWEHFCKYVAHSTFELMKHHDEDHYRRVATHIYPLHPPSGLVTPLSTTSRATPASSWPRSLLLLLWSITRPGMRCCACTGRRRW